MYNRKTLELKVTKLVDSLFIGNYKTAFKGRGLEFSDYISYEPGDDARYIDWIASKREGKLLVKRFEEERELQVFFLLDISETMNFGYGEKTKKDTLLEVFYILAYSAISNNDKIGAIVLNDSGFQLVKPGKGKKAIFQILQIIEGNKIPHIPQFDINILFSFFNSLPVKNSLVFFLSDKIGEIYDKNIKITSIKNDFVYINIFDYFENNLTSSPSITPLGFLNQHVFIHLRSKKKIAQYQELRKEKIKAFHKKLLSYGIDYLCLDEQKNVFKELLTFFHRR